MSHRDARGDEACRQCVCTRSNGKTAVEIRIRVRLNPSVGLPCD